ncbi:MAG: M18 family aminopeptidase [Helicobacteraceae bacterium]|jgi:aspartyl aminopeptidase|nr:M18 family aminopeptidase [Helicobacteraceae bacterium]
MNIEDFNSGLLGFLDASPTPFHATRNMAMMCANAGFIQLDETQKWVLEKGQKYFVTRNASSIIAFTYPGNDDYVMMGAHTDSPNLKLKPSPVIEKNGLVQLGVEPYGGVLFNPWFDRDLSIAGRVAYKDREGGIQEALIDLKKAIAIIPSLAIHLDSEVHEKHAINAQTDIVPIITSGKFDFSAWIKEALVQEGHDDFESLLSHELSLYDTQKASFVGLEEDFIASARLDNLLSCYVSLLTICSVASSQPYLMICSDHEEVGSASTSGAAGSFLESVLRRMTPDFESYTQLTRKSIMISCDNAHAIHPNFASKHEENHAPRINEGVVIKVNANQRYASNSRTISTLTLAAEKQNIKLQEFVTRSDMGCGSTIGPITATRLGIDTIDVGLPTFAMHSIRELAGSKDAHQLYRILFGMSS